MVLSNERAQLHASGQIVHLLERKFKTKETIALLEEYDDMIRELGNLYFLGSGNIPVRDFEAATSRLLKIRSLTIFIYFL